MTTAGLSRAMTELAAIVPDQVLLARFLERRDEEAFAELVGRHGPMVLAVCRRVLGDTHHAEDAFQATFLVLARKGLQLRPGGVLAGWLHGIARKAALEARRRRRSRETLVPAVPETSPRSEDLPDRELLARLDQELERLPEALRAPVVLCELEGRSRREAARLLQIPEGTLSSRLAAARKRLARALNGYGLASVLALADSTHVTAALVRATVRTALAPSSSSTVTALAGGVTRMLFLSKLKAFTIVAAMSTIIGLIAFVSTGFATGVPSQGQPTTPRPVLAETVGTPKADPVRVGEGQILVWAEGQAMLLGPDGKVIRRWQGDQVPHAGGARLSPDGRSIAVLKVTATLVQEKKVPVGHGALNATITRHLYQLVLYPVADRLVEKPVKLPGDSVRTVLWSGDGTKLYAQSHDDYADRAHTFAKKNVRTWTIDAGTLEARPLAFPDNHILKDVSRDGKQYLTLSPGLLPSRDPWGAYLVSAEGRKAPVALGFPREHTNDLALSPDGKQALTCGFGRDPRVAKLPAPDPNQKDTREAGDDTIVPPPAGGVAFGWFDRIELGAMMPRTLVPLEEMEYVNACRWSPDARRVAYIKNRAPVDLNNQKSTITVLDLASGREVFTHTVEHGSSPLFIDWR
jgi:RNA polymerase sigma factor (sigma-70 family)